MLKYVFKLISDRINVYFDVPFIKMNEKWKKKKLNKNASFSMSLARKTPVDAYAEWSDCVLQHT